MDIFSLDVGNRICLGNQLLDINSSLSSVVITTLTKAIAIILFVKLGSTICFQNQNHLLQLGLGDQKSHLGNFGINVHDVSWWQTYN